MTIDKIIKSKHSNYISVIDYKSYFYHFVDLDKMVFNLEVR